MAKDIAGETTEDYDGFGLDESDIATSKVELFKAGDSRYEGEVQDGTFTVLSLSDADAATLGGAATVIVRAAE